MDENKKEVIKITNEGIIIVDDLVADFRYLYDKIKTKSCVIIIYNEASYLNLLVPFENWLSERVSEDDFKETVAYVKSEWQKCLEIINTVKDRKTIKLN